MASLVERTNYVFKKNLETKKGVRHISKALWWGKFGARRTGEKTEGRYARKKMAGTNVVIIVPASLSPFD